MCAEWVVATQRDLLVGFAHLIVGQDPGLPEEGAPVPSRRACNRLPLSGACLPLAVPMLLQPKDIPDLDLHGQEAGTKMLCEMVAQKVPEVMLRNERQPGSALLQLSAGAPLLWMMYEYHQSNLRQNVRPLHMLLPVIMIVDVIPW